MVDTDSGAQVKLKRKYYSSICIYHMVTHNLHRSCIFSQTAVATVRI